MVRYAYAILRVEIHLPGRYQPVRVAWRASRVRGLVELPAVGVQDVDDIRFAATMLFRQGVIGLVQLAAFFVREEPAMIAVDEQPGLGIVQVALRVHLAVILVVGNAVRRESLLSIEDHGIASQGKDLLLDRFRRIGIKVDGGLIVGSSRRCRDRGGNGRAKFPAFIFRRRRPGRLRCRGSFLVSVTRRPEQRVWHPALHRHRDKPRRRPRRRRNAIARRRRAMPAQKTAGDTQQWARGGSASRTTSC